MNKRSVAHSISKRKLVRHDNKKNVKAKEIEMKPSIHRRILNFLNDAVWVEDLVYERITNVPLEGELVHEDNLAEFREKPKRFWTSKLLDRLSITGIVNIRLVFAI